MCLICVEIQKGELSPNDFIRKVDMVLQETPEHEEELTNALANADQQYLDKLEKFLLDKIIKDFVDVINVK